MSNILSSPEYQPLLEKIKRKVLSEHNGTIIQPMSVTTYQLSNRLPDNLEAYLPSRDQIERNLLEFLSKDERE